MEVHHLNKRDYYEVLGIAKDAQDTDIKKAYRKLSMKYHPDKNKAADATEKFKEIQEAYDVLSNGEKRAQYDQYGHTDFGQGGYGGFSGGGFGGGGFEDINLGDIFEGFFGGGNRRKRYAGPVKGDDLMYRLSISFMEAAFGVEKDILSRREDTCDICGGSGAKKGTSKETCPTCKGTGQVMSSMGFFQSMRTCPRCNGSGTIIKEPCNACHGHGRVRKERKIHLKIPAGVFEGARIRVPDEGDAGTNGGSYGDLYVQVTIADHPEFKREGNDVYSEVKINIIQASLGDTIEVNTIHGKDALEIPEGTQFGSTFRIKDKGIPKLKTGGHGDHYVFVKVVVPTGLGKEQRQQLEALKYSLANSPLSFKPRKEKKVFYEKIRDFFQGE